MLEDQVIVALRQIAQAIEQYSRQLFQECGLTAPQIGTLRELDRLGASSPGALAEVLHLAPPTIVGIVARLEERGLVRRSRDREDGRSVVLCLTAKGRKALAQAPPLLRDRFRQQLARLPDWEQTQMLATLQRIAYMMNADAVEPAPFLCTDDSLAHVEPARPAASA